MMEERSDSVLDLRLRGRWFQPHGRHCVVSLSKILYPLLSTGSTQEAFPMTKKLLIGM